MKSRIPKCSGCKIICALRRSCTGHDTQAIDDALNASEVCDGSWNRARSSIGAVGTAEQFAHALRFGFYLAPRHDKNSVANRINAGMTDFTESTFAGFLLDVV
ncbi:hypothetical protein C9427_31215 [Mesorhizobium helmanticense]|uniref:Uncharacterized protein n=1 Tax=Mesorhizobium helmanticense TaxID=1776423 RepID=A0A2T4ILP8_9HYPH|nr:hypothetical protein C9427_31215 [Mesorhizobium helmanticense]